MGHRDRCLGPEETVWQVCSYSWRLGLWVVPNFFPPTRFNSHFGSQFSAKFRTGKKKNSFVLNFMFKLKENIQCRMLFKWRDCFETLKAKCFLLCKYNFQFVCICLNTSSQNVTLLRSLHGFSSEQSKVRLRYCPPLPYDFS